MSKYRRAKRPILGATLACTGFLVLASTCLARTEIAILTPNEPASGFGKAVAIDGDYIVVGAPGHNQRGAIVIFHFEQGAWVEHTRIEPTVAPHSVFGASVAVEGDLIAVGLPHDWPTEHTFGGVRLYRLIGNQWIFEQSLFTSGKAVGDHLV